VSNPAIIFRSIKSLPNFGGLFRLEEIDVETTDVSEVQKAADVVRAIVTDSGSILGSKLAIQLKSEIPEWSAQAHGSRSLRDFILTHVAGVRIAGRSGLDIVYGLAESPTSLESPTEHNYWRIWVSPNGPYYLAIRESDGLVVAQPRRAELPMHHKRLDPASAEQHRELASAFVTSLPTESRDLLLAIAESTDDHWWHRWFGKLGQIGELANWSSFRRTKLRELLRERLLELELAEGAADAAFLRISKGPKQSVGDQVDVEARSLGSLNMREIAVKTISMMSEKQIRELQLPFGLVLDAVKTLDHK